MSSVISSKTLSSIRQSALTLIGEIRSCQRNADALIDQAREAGILPNRAEGETEMAFLAKIAANASEAEADVRKQEALDEVNAVTSGQRRVGHSSTVGRFFGKLANIAG